MNQQILGWVVGCALLGGGCSEVNQADEVRSEQDEIVANLLLAGFPRDDIQVVDGEVYTGRDAKVSLAASREMIADAGGDSREQYRTSNLVSLSLEEICVDGSGVSGTYSAALDAAIQNFNELALSFTMRRINSPDPTCLALIVVQFFGGSGEVSGYPAGGLPYGNIYLGTEPSGAGGLEHRVTHALGHTVGLRHSDYYDRSISCGTGGNEGDAGVGAIHIPGTPTTASPGASVMNSCFNGTESGDFSATDAISLRPLYPRNNPTVWTSAFGNVTGWMASPWYWGTIRFPDVNGDGGADVCGRGGGGIFCALSNGSSFGPASYWTTSYSDGTNWASSESYWGTIRFPDLNGDGRADVCGRGGGGLFCALSNGNSFGASTYWTSAFSNATGWMTAESTWRTIDFPDLNGDGRADVCGRGTGGILCALSTGSAFSGASYWSTSYSDAAGWAAYDFYWGTIRYPDLNGDGRADVCGRGYGGLYCALSSGTSFGANSFWSTSYSNANGWASSEASWGSIQYADLNGDGRFDVCGLKGELYCALSNGGAFGGMTNWSAQLGYAAPVESYWRTMRFPDVDGDGKADVCARAKAGVFCASSTASSFAAGGFLTSNFSDYHGWGASPSYWATLAFPDVNGDGVADVCGRGGSGIYCAP